jgi:protein-disulfide isomerase
VSESSRRRAILRRHEARQRRLMLIGGVVAVAVVAIGAVLLLNSGQGGAATGNFVPGNPAPVPYADGKALGQASAPVLVQEFADFQCPYCKLFHDTIQGQLVEQYVASGQVRFEFHHFIVIDGNVGGHESRHAAEASECANEQAKFWNYHAMLYANQGSEGGGSFADNRLVAFADSLGLAEPQFQQCLSSGQYAQTVMADEQMARSLGVNSTPSVFVNGQPVGNPLDYSQVSQAIEAQLAATQ